MKKKLILSIMACTVFFWVLIPIAQAVTDATQPNTTSAQSTKGSTFNAPNLSISIPGMDKLEPVKCDADNTNCSIPWIAKYIGALQRYAIGIVGIIAVITLMMGGVIWLTSGGDQNKIGEAKNWITGSLIGLTLTLASYLILYTINPELTVLRNINLTYLGKQDLPEVQVDTVELDKNLEETKKSGKVQMGNYCGCFNYKDSKSTTKLNTAAAINEAIAYLSPSSPLKNKGQTILDAANKYGFDPALFVAKCKQENGLGTANSTIVQSMKNLASIMCGDTPGCKSHGCGTAKNGRKWRSYDSWEDSIDDYFCFMKNSKVMGPSNSLRELITKYCPPCLYKGKCDCNTSQYIDGVASIMQKYNNNSFDSDKPNGSNCGCYDMAKHCTDRSTSYCTDYGK